MFIPPPAPIAATIAELESISSHNVTLESTRFNAGRKPNIDEILKLITV